MFLLKMAVRNLVRNLRRSLITGSAISLGLALLLWASAFTDGITAHAIEKGIGAMGGHVVVQGQGWQRLREASIVVPDTPAVQQRLSEAVPDALIVKRVFIDGLLTSPTGAMGVGVVGVEPELARRVDPLPEVIDEGTYLDDDERGIVIGGTLAESLDVGLGDKVVLITQGPEEVESRLFRVKGIFRFGVDEMDGFVAQVTLAAAQDLLGLGNDVTQVALHLPDPRDTRRSTTRTEDAVGGPQVEVLPWQEALPELADYVAKEQSDLLVFFPVIGLMIMLGIVNTVLMSVLERTREFGVLMSIGLSHTQTAALVLLEAALLGMAASLVGFGIGQLLILPFATSGLDLSALTDGESVQVAGVARDMIMYPQLSYAKALWFCIGATGVTIAAAVYPAWTVTRLSPVDALRHDA
jgi:ABC-type lipoprotein release transport system permease subunit